MTKLFCIVLISFYVPTQYLWKIFMSYNYEKSDKTLQLQLVRMQLETIAYCRISRGLATESLVDTYEALWLSLCKKDGITPANSFKDEFKTFQKESVLKFAPEKTFINMEEKAKITLKKFGINEDMLGQK